MVGRARGESSLLSAWITGARRLLRSIDRRWLKRRLYLWRHFDRMTRSRILELSRRPVVLGGCGRSGTTLLLSVLSCHPHIWAVPEETRAFCPRAYRSTPDLQAEFELEWIYDRLAAEEIPQRCLRWCEKTPKNIVTIERILRYLGRRARFIQIVRDGRDVVTSVHPRDPSRYWVEPRRWIQEVGAGHRFAQHPQVLTVRYEDLIGEYESTVRRVCAFLDEEFDPAMLAYPEAATVRTNTAWFRPATQVYSGSIGRWREPQHRKRIESLLRDPAAEELLQHYGYLEATG